MLCAPLARTISLYPGQSMFVNLGAMEAFSGKTVSMDTGVQTSWFTTIVRKFFSENSILLNRFTANEGTKGWITLEEVTPGQLAEHNLLPGSKLIMKNGAFSACDSNIEVSYHISGIHGSLSKLGFFALEAKTKDTKSGRIFFNSGGGIIRRIEVTEENSPIIVDNKNLVAYSGSLTIGTTAPGGLTSWAYGEEGIAATFRGKGTVYIGSPQNSHERSADIAMKAARRAEQALEEIKKLSIALHRTEATE